MQVLLMEYIMDLFAVGVTITRVCRPPFRIRDRERALSRPKWSKYREEMARKLATLLQ